MCLADRVNQYLANKKDVRFGEPNEPIEADELLYRLHRAQQELQETQEIVKQLRRKLGLAA